LNADKFGYQFASPTPEDFNMVTTHTVTVTELTPGTTYNFRCVSHASPPTITREFSFTTLAALSGQETIEQGGEIPAPTGGTPEAGGTVTPGTEIGPGGEALTPTPEGGLTPSPSPEPGTEEVTTTAGGNTSFGANMLAAIGSIMNSTFLLVICIILLIILIALIIKELRYRYLEYKRKRKSG
jgi:hypothetical protein